MGTDDEPAYQQLGQAGEDSIEVTVGTDVEDIQFEPEGVSRRRSAAGRPAAGLSAIPAASKMEVPFRSVQIGGALMRPHLRPVEVRTHAQH